MIKVAVGGTYEYSDVGGTAVISVVSINEPYQWIVLVNVISYKGDKRTSGWWSTEYGTWKKIEKERFIYDKLEAILKKVR